MVTRKFSDIHSYYSLYCLFKYIVLFFCVCFWNSRVTYSFIVNDFHNMIVLDVLHILCVYVCLSPVRHNKHQSNYVKIIFNFFEKPKNFSENSLRNGIVNQFSKSFVFMGTCFRYSSLS